MQQWFRLANITKVCYFTTIC